MYVNNYIFNLIKHIEVEKKKHDLLNSFLQCFKIISIVFISFTLFQDIRNTVGNIPMHWYDELDHIGYDIEGNKIMKPSTGDEIDEFLSKMDDPNYWYFIFI